MNNYKEENGKFYRQSSKGDWFEVNIENGKFTWIQPDGKKVYDPNVKIPVMQESSNSILGKEYIVNVGSNGSIMRTPSRLEAIKAYNKALQSGSFQDPSQNQLNSTIFDTLTFGLPLVKGIGSGIINTAKFLKNSSWQSILNTTIKNIIPSIGGGIALGTATDAVSESTTGNSFGKNVNKAISVVRGTEYPEDIEPLLNIGYSYGGFLGNNFYNRGRYFLNGVKPVAYSGHSKKELIKPFLEPFYKSPPKFSNYRPSWYKDGKFYENRFQNGAIWADIPESEVSRSMYAKNSNGTYRMTKEGTLNNPPLEDKTTVAEDFLTVGSVGGEHSNYKLITNDFSKYSNQYPKNTKLMLFSDQQKLNPQWQLSDKIKSKYNLEKGTTLYNIVDRLGGVPLDPIVGYKPFTIEQFYVIEPNGYTTPLFQDTSEIYNLLNIPNK